jgi:hypothetical protein
VPIDREIPEIPDETAQELSDEVPHADDVSDEKTLEAHSPSDIAPVEIADETPPTEQAGEGAETPIGTLLQGTLAPPSTPFVPKSVPEIPSGLIAASVHSLSTERLDHFAPVEVDEIHQHDVQEIPPVEQVSAPAEDAQVEEAEVAPVEGVPIQEVEQTEAGEVPSEEYQAAEREESLEEPVQIGRDASNPDEEEVDDISKGKDDPPPVLEEAAAITTIPAVFTAGTIGLVATATQHKEPLPDLAGTEDSTPLIHVMTSDTPSLAIEGPFVEPLKNYDQPEEILETPSDQDTQNLTSRYIPLPREPTRLPNGRPSTSYSWLGHLFQPISPEIIEAEQNGWVAVPEIDDKPAHADPPVRRHSSRLKRRLKRLSRVQEQVPSLMSLQILIYRMQPNRGVVR